MIVYSIADDFTVGNGVWEPGLEKTIRDDVALDPKFDGMNVKRHLDLVEMFFDPGLSAPEKTSLDAIVAAHDGTKPKVWVPVLDLLIVPTEEVIGGGGWKTPGGATSRPAAINSDLSKLQIRISLGYMVAGSGAQARVMENGVRISPLEPLPDTSGAWVTHAFSTNVDMKKGRNTYEFGARRNGASSVDVRYVVFTLREAD